MNFLRFFISWKFWISMILMLLITGGIIYWSKGYLNSITNHGEKIEVPKIDSLSIMEAKEILTQHNLSIIIDSAKFEEKYQPFQIYQQEPKAGNYVKKGRSILVKANPKTFKPVKMPSLIDRSIRLARQHLDLVSLKVGNITYEPHIAKDVVLKTIFNGNEIFPGQELPKYATVDLVLGEGYKENVEVPNLRGLTTSEAIIALNKVELNLGTVISTNVNDSLLAKIYNQSPSAGTMLEMGLPINLWITNTQVKANYKHDLAKFPDSLKVATNPNSTLGNKQQY